MKLLLLTLYAPIGGVPATTRAFASALRDLGHDVTIAFSCHRTVWPHLSVRPWQVPTRIPTIESTSYLGFPAFAVGAYVPELECCRYFSHRGWEELVDRADACVGVLGSVLPAYVFAGRGRRALCWIGTPYVADRQDRTREFSLPRRALDRVIEQPLCERLERLALREIDVLSVSPYTQAALRRIEPKARLAGVLQPPVDLALFSPGPRRGAAVPYRIGFVGRVEDPRKNVTLLIMAATELLARRLPVEVHVFGGAPSRAVTELIGRHGLSDTVKFHPRGEARELVAFYRSLDVFVIPSHQEGFAVVGIEAMACGTPVVSTPCGGPAAYIKDGETGAFAGFDPASMADRIQSLLENAPLRRRLADAALEHVRRHNAPEAFHRGLADHLAAWLSGGARGAARKAA